MSGLTVWIDGVGVLGPGLESWAQARDVLGGTLAHACGPTQLPAPARLPAAERRRAGAAVKLALAVADQATAHADVDLGRLATVFSSSSGEGTICHQLCEALAGPTPLVSPTRFTNSVHNAAAGCWHIAVASRASSTSLCAHDGSFAAGLLEAACSVQCQRQPLLLVASDSPYPQPLHATRPLPDHFGVALLLRPTRTPQSLVRMAIELVDGTHPPSGCTSPSLDALSRQVPAAASLPLLQALANAPCSVVMPCLEGLRLRIHLGRP